MLDVLHYVEEVFLERLGQDVDLELEVMQVFVVHDADGDET